MSQGFLPPTGLVEFNNQLVFNAYTVSEGTESWRSDGTGSGAVLVQEFRLLSNHLKLLRLLSFAASVVVPGDGHQPRQGRARRGVVP